MKKIDRIRAREGARVCLIEARDLVDKAKYKLLDVDPGNLRLREEFTAIFEKLNRLLFHVVDDQSRE